MTNTKTKLENAVAVGLPTYLISSIIVAVYISVRHPTGSVSIPTGDVVLTNATDIIFGHVHWAVLIVFVAIVLKDFTEHVNWLFAGVGIGLTTFVIFLVQGILEGASITVINILATILGVGILLPICFGIVGQLIKQYNIDDWLLSQIGENKEEDEAED